MTTRSFFGFLSSFSLKDGRHPKRAESLILLLIVCGVCTVADAADTVTVSDDPEKMAELVERVHGLLEEPEEGNAATSPDPRLELMRRVWVLVGDEPEQQKEVLKAIAIAAEDTGERGIAYLVLVSVYTQPAIPDRVIAEAYLELLASAEATPGVKDFADDILRGLAQREGLAPFQSMLQRLRHQQVRGITEELVVNRMAKADALEMLSYLIGWYGLSRDERIYILDRAKTIENVSWRQREQLPIDTDLADQARSADVDLRKLDYWWVNAALEAL